MHFGSHTAEEKLRHEMDYRSHTFDLVYLHLSGLSLLEESLAERLAVFEGKFREECHPYLHRGKR